MVLHLFAHNQKAYEAALSQLTAAGRAAVIHPTGTGKSMIAFKLAEEHPSARICWLAPSRYIFRQQQENLHKSCPDCRLENITFLTYARLMANRDRVEALRPDFIILDEFHRCGAAEWSKGVQALLEAWPQAKVLGLSATSIRYLDGCRDMAEELFGGHIASEMTLGESIAQGILASPRYVVSIYRYETELRRCQEKLQGMRDSQKRRQAEKQLEKLRRALQEADGLPVIFQRYLKPTGKYIVFCPGRGGMEEIRQKAGEWFGPVDQDYHCYQVYSQNQKSAQEFREFKEDRSAHLKLLFCIDMLNEGIHVDDVDGVLLMRPTVSPVIYKQQIGRALTAGRRVDRGTRANQGIRTEQETPAEQKSSAEPMTQGAYGEPPLILDVVNNFAALDSIHSLEVEYEQALQKGISGQEQPGETTTSGFQIIDETRNAGKLFCELQEKLDVGWEEYYQAAVAYHREKGNLEIPVRYRSPDGLMLGSWLQTQRRIYTGKLPGRLSEEQAMRLETLGICWESHSDRQWQRYYDRAAAYYAHNGNLDIKISYVTEDGFRLGIWLNNLRQYRQNGSRLLSDTRRKQLEQIGMIWDKLSYKWERGCEAARQYYETFGNLDVPSDYICEDGFRLGNWIAAQRQIRRGANKGALPLTQEQIARLDRLGMDWEGKQAGHWEQCYQEAVKYWNERGTLDIPREYVTESGILLGKWVAGQRGIKDPERIARLNAIGMVWEKNPWMEKWELARQYHEKNGNLDIPQDYVVNGVWLGKWLYRQRQVQETLTRTQFQALDSIGMDWLRPNERAWEEAFGKAKAYYEGNHHLEVEKGYSSSDGFRLDLWVNRQRKAYREGKNKVLSAGRIARLTEIGMRWE